MMDRNRARDIEARLKQVRAEIDSAVTLIVVTKNFPLSDIEILFALGERNFGENRVQELVQKREGIDPRMDQEITWHFQGGIQSNKTPLLNRFADVIHSVDSLKVIDRLDDSKRVFLQINLDSPIREGGGDVARSGIDPSDLEHFASSMSKKFGENFLGVMGVAPHFAGITPIDISVAFSKLQSISSKVMEIAPSATAISAGMSDDYPLALEHGATHIRLGSSILGRRQPTA
jgi:pyridoxal phosphate enzyme (YggS family)